MDPQTGRLTTVFDDNPQLPFSELQLHFKSGPRAPLTTPSECGTRTADASFEPWSGTAPINLSPTIVTNEGCEVQAMKAGFEAGTVNPVGGEHSPLELRLSRADDQPEGERFTADLPTGLLAVLRGVPYCPPAALAAAAGHSGGAEQADPSCPSASQIGKVDAGVAGAQGVRGFGLPRVRALLDVTR